MSTSTKYIINKICTTLSTLEHQVEKMQSEYRPTSTAASTLRIRLTREPNKNEVFALFSQFSKLHPELTCVRIKENLLVFYFSKKHSTLRNSKSPANIYVTEDSMLRLLKPEDRIELPTFEKSSIGRFFKVLRIGLKTIFLQPEVRSSRVSLPAERFSFSLTKCAKI